MAGPLKGTAKNSSFADFDFSQKKIGLVVADFNEDITYSLRDACSKTLVAHGISSENISTHHVPGAFELPLGAKWLLKKPLNAVILLGCVITGETKHDEYISNSVSMATMQLGLLHDKPVIFGLLTPRNMEQALARAGGELGNKGEEAALAALQMMRLKDELTQASKEQIGF